MAVTVDLSPQEQAAFEAQARAEGLSVEDWLKKLARQHARSAGSGEARQKLPGDYRPISQVITEIMSDVPHTELAKLPKDGASQVDHYIHGHPKR